MSFNDDDELYADPDLPAGDISGLPPEQQGQLEALAQTLDDLPEVPEAAPLEEFNVTDPIDLIPIAIANSRLLQIMYQNRRGETKTYVVEPREIGGSFSHPAGYLWAYDRNAGTIKSFFLSNLLEIQLLDEEFIPGLY